MTVVIATLVTRVVVMIDPLLLIVGDSTDYRLLRYGGRYRFTLLRCVVAVVYLRCYVVDDSDSPVVPVPLR